MTSLVNSLRDFLADWSCSTAAVVYPPVCVHCGVPRPAAAREELSSRRRFCGDCYEQLRGRIDHACLTCGAPVGPFLDTWGCRHCRGDNFAFERVVALGVYEPLLKDACGRGKEPGGAPLTAGLSELLFEAHEATLSGADMDVVVPVPHHWWERISATHHPPVTMARVLARRLSIPMTTHILTKRRRTPAQSTLSPARRRRNLANAFGLVGRPGLKGVNVLLTDDILTTGTTADRAAGVLMQAGAARVLVAVLARGLGHASSF